jgi:hypothetical protein
VGDHDAEPATEHGLQMCLSLLTDPDRGPLERLGSLTRSSLPRSEDRHLGEAGWRASDLLGRLNRGLPQSKLWCLCIGGSEKHALHHCQRTAARASTSVSYVPARAFCIAAPVVRRRSGWRRTVGRPRHGAAYGPTRILGRLVSSRSAPGRATPRRPSLDDSPWIMQYCFCMEAILP